MVAGELLGAHDDPSRPDPTAWDRATAPGPAPVWDLDGVRRDADGGYVIGHVGTLWVNLRAPLLGTVGVLAWFLGWLWVTWPAAWWLAVPLVSLYPLAHLYVWVSTTIDTARRHGDPRAGTRILLDHTRARWPQ